MWSHEGSPRLWSIMSGIGIFWHDGKEKGHGSIESKEHFGIFNDEPSGSTRGKFIINWCHEVSPRFWSIMDGMGVFFA